jgi:hypothetical protein
MAAREKWRATWTLIAHNNRTVELPQELSEADCNSKDLREFYCRFPEAAKTVIFQLGERFKDARTLILRRKLMQNISHGVWDIGCGKMLKKS